jgi:Ca2+-binding RTX toxin-like protein
MTHAPRICEIEHLELRTLLSSTPTDMLVVRATDFTDVIQVDVRRASNGTKQLVVNITGVQRKFDLTGINTIEIDALGGNDTVIVKSSVVRGFIINGGLGDDLITGGAGNDHLIGGRGIDRLNGGEGNDYLKGYDGDDFLQGGDGNDSLDGGNGQDTMIGNSGTDIFIGNNSPTDQLFQ